MVEYIEREAAISCVNNYHYPTEPNVAWMSLEYAISALRRIPAADVRPVVTCGECIHYKKRFWDNGKCYGTFCDIWNRDHGKTFFCSAGKREVDNADS